MQHYNEIVLSTFIITQLAIVAPYIETFLFVKTSQLKQYFHFKTSKIDSQATKIFHLRSDSTCSYYKCSYV